MPEETETPLTPCWKCGVECENGIFYCPEHPPSDTQEPPVATSGERDVDWTAPHRLQRLWSMCRRVDAPWKLIPHTQTTTGTVILHDANGMSIADLQTAGPPCDCDRLIAIAPVAIQQLVEEVHRLQRRLAVCTRQEVELHVAISRDASSRDSKMLVGILDSDHQDALARVRRLHAVVDGIEAIATSRM